MQTKVGPHATPSPPWGVPHDPGVLAPRCAEVRALAGALAVLPVLPRERQDFAAECARRGGDAAQALAGGSVTLERPGDGAVRSGQAAAVPAAGGEGEGWSGCGARIADIRERLAAWWMRHGGGRIDRPVLEVFRDAFGTGRGQRDGPDPGGVAQAAGGAAVDRAQAVCADRLIAAFAAWFDGPDMAGEEAVVRAALAHYHVLSLRPLSAAFAPAALLAETVLLQAAGHRLPACLMPEYYLRHAARYRRLSPVHPALRPPGPSVADDPTPFVAFCLDGLLWALREVGGRVAEGVRRVVLERHYQELRQSRQVTARQHALLSLLLDAQGPPVGIRSLCRLSPYSLLYGRASEQTARRDLKRLSGMGLLASEAGGFVLNRGVLCG